MIQRLECLTGRFRYTLTLQKGSVLSLWCLRVSKVLIPDPIQVFITGCYLWDAVEEVVVTEGNGGFESVLESRNPIENDSGMRLRPKECSECGVIREILYRCKYRNLDWRFLCESCLNTIEDQYPEPYSYSGTWKSKKK